VQARHHDYGQSISALYVPMGAVTVSDEVNEPFAAGETFVHGFTNGSPTGVRGESRVARHPGERQARRDSAEVGA